MPKAGEPSRRHNPDHKMRSDGGMIGGSRHQRRAKAYRVTGQVRPDHREVGNGTENLGAKRIWKWLFGDDDKK